MWQFAFMKFAKILRPLSVLALWPLALSAQINITGVADKTTYNNSVTLTVGTQAGFDYNATLNWQPIAAGGPVVVNKPDFYDLRVDATNQVGGAGCRSGRCRPAPAERWR